MFYKFINETTIEQAPRPLLIDDKHVFTNSEVMHNENGYYRLTNDKYPQDGKCYTVKYVLEDNVIRETYIAED